MIASGPDANLLAGMMEKLCDCGSGQAADAVTDGYNIFLCYACASCRRRKVARYRTDIFERYECDEPIEEE